MGTCRSATRGGDARAPTGIPSATSVQGDEPRPATGPPGKNGAPVKGSPIAGAPQDVKRPNPRTTPVTAAKSRLDGGEDRHLPGRGAHQPHRGEPLLSSGSRSRVSVPMKISTGKINARRHTDRMQRRCR